MEFFWFLCICVHAAMTTRNIDLKDMHSVRSVCINAFMESVAPTLQEEGIKTFQNIASLEGLQNRMEADNDMLVYENRGEVVGYIELKEGRHIAMLFVSPRFQKRGVGKSLISKILPYAKRRNNCKRFTNINRGLFGIWV